MNGTVLEEDKVFLRPYITYINMDVFKKEYLNSYEYNDPSLKEFISLYNNPFNKENDLVPHILIKRRSK